MILFLLFKVVLNHISSTHWLMHYQSIYCFPSMRCKARVRHCSFVVTSRDSPEISYPGTGDEENYSDEQA
jgi:hypothetical protein